MDELRTLFRQGFHYIAGRVGVILIGLVSFPLFTRMLSVSDYGLMSFALKIAAFFAILSKLGVQQALLRFWDEHAASGEPDRLKRFFSSIFFGTVGSAVAATLLFVAGVTIMPDKLVTRPMKQLLLFAAILIFIRGMFSMLAAFLRVREMTKAYNVLDVGQKVGMIVATCAFFIVWRHDAWAFVAGAIVAEGLVMLFVSFFLLQRQLLAPKHFDGSMFRQALLFGLPLSLLELTNVILDSGDRVLVQHYLGTVQLGYYSAVYNLSTYLEAALTIPLNLALFPIFMKVWVKKGKEETQAFLSRGLELFLFLNVGVLGAVVVTSGDAMDVLASSKYREAHNLLPILVAGLLFYAAHFFLSAGLLIYKRTFTVVRVLAYACAINIVMNMVLLPKMGLLAAAIATLVSYVFLVLLLGRASFQVLPFRIEYGSIGRFLLAGAFTVGVLWRLDLGYSVLNLLVKGILSLLLYCGAVWLLNPRIRILIPKRAGAGQQPSKKPTAALDETVVASLTDAMPVRED